MDTVHADSLLNNLYKMLNFIDHPSNTFIVGKSADLVELGKTKSLDGSSLSRILRDQALRQFDLYHNVTYFLLMVRVLPLIRPTSSALRRERNPANVARRTLCGLFVPMALVRMS